MMSGPGTAFLLLLAGIAAPEADARVEYAQLTIRRRIIVRVPTAPPTVTRWKQRKGPKCLDAALIGGAVVIEMDNVDFVLKGGRRYRAKLERSCPALDYYSGFYLVPTDDGRICADRDAIHARSGGECQIGKFIELTPEK